MKSSPKSVLLVDSQKRALDRLINKIMARASKDYQLFKSCDLDENVGSRVFGILGDRGSGKSMICGALYKASLDPCYRVSDDEDTLNHYFFPVRPIDCSVIDSATPPGMALLIQILASINDVQEAGNLAEQQLYENLKNELHSLLCTYGNNTPAFDDLCLELSSSIEDYGRYLHKGVSERLGLKKALGIWLKKALATVQKRAFLVILDDFDLIRVDTIHRWLQHFFDELHQPYLYFVLATDFYRLEYLTISEKEQYDDKTSRKLIYRLLPLNQRVEVGPWSWEDISDNEYLSDDVKRVIESNFNKESAQLIFQLWPKTPRGVVDFQRTIKEVNFEEANLNGKPFLSWFLANLAWARQESLLARRIQELDVFRWVTEFDFSEEGTVTDLWQEVVNNAYGSLPLSDQSKSLPIIPLVLDNRPWLESGRLYKNNSRKRLGSGRDEFGHSPNWRFPLRHDHQRFSPLHDAVNPQTWAHLLVSIGLSGEPPIEIESDRDNDEKEFRLRPATILRNKVHFIEGWQLLNNRSQRAEFVIKQDKQPFLAAFGQDTLPARPGFFFLQYQAGGDARNVTFSFGWRALFESIRGKQYGVLERQFSEWNLSLSTLEHSDDNLKPGALSIVPDQLWAIILLMEGLDRCPWVAYSRPSVWPLSTHLTLAAIFVRAAYVHGLVNTNTLVLDDELASHTLYRALEERNATLLPQGHEDMLDFMAHVFDEDLTLGEDALSRAAQAYLVSPPYRAVQKMHRRIMHLAELERRAR